MEIYICQLEHLNNYPPTISLIHYLANSGHRITLISSNIQEETIAKFQKMNVYIINIPIKLLKNTNLYATLTTKIYNKKLIRKIIIENCPPGSILWTTTDNTAAAIGNILYRYIHIMQLMELIEDFPLSYRFPFIKANLAQYAQKACCVVVPEYNRAHIQKAWWKLKKVPFLLPNKPNYHPRKKQLPLDKDLKKGIDIIKKTMNKKIILYQGGFGPDRKLDIIAEAVKILGSDYNLILMGKYCDTIKNLMTEYQNIYHIDYIFPPKHLIVTSYAHIGVLSYVTDEPCCHYSLLNALFCAPNKIYEYAGFGLPMVGNDIPGLKAILEGINTGVCANEMTVQAFVEAFKQVESQYEKMSNNATGFFDSIDMEKYINNILTCVTQEANNANYK